MSLPTKTTDSPVGNALNINAGITLLPVGDAASWHTGSWSAALWFKSTTASGGTSAAKIISRDASEYFHVALVQSANTNSKQNLVINITTTNGTANDEYTVQESVTVNKWHHLALSFNGTIFKAYLDGESVFTRSTYDPNSSPPNRILAVGADVGSSGILTTNKFIGALTEVKLFNTALSGAKIRGLYQSPGSTSVGTTDSTIKFGGGTSGNNLKISSDGISAGHSTFGSAPFSVTPAGAVTINSITSTYQNSPIDLEPNGSGVVTFKGNSVKGAGQFKLNCEQNSHGIIIKGPPHSAGASYTLTLPNTDGDANQVLKTDGSGNLDWVDQSSGSVRTVGVDTNGDGSTNNTLESGETLVLKAGSNVTLAETGGVVTINSSGGGGGSSVTVVDEDDMSSNSATSVPSQQSVKAYVDNNAVKRSIFHRDRYLALTTSYQDYTGNFYSQARTGIPHLREVEFTAEFDYSGVPASIVNDLSLYLEVNTGVNGYVSVTKTATHVTSQSGLHTISFAGDVSGYFGDGVAFAASNTSSSYSQKFATRVYYIPTQDKTYVEYATTYGQLMTSGTLTVYISINAFLASASYWRVVKEFKLDRAQSTTTTQNVVQTFRAVVGVYDGALTYRVRAREISSGDSGIMQELHGTVIDSVWEE